MSISLNSGVTLFRTLLCVSPLVQTLQMPLLYEILIITSRLQPPHLLTFFFSFFLYKFSIVFSPQIDRYGLQWDSFLSIFPVLLVMAQVHCQNPIKWVQEKGVALEPVNETEPHERRTLVAHVQRVWTQTKFCYFYYSYFYLFISIS